MISNQERRPGPYWFGTMDRREYVIMTNARMLSEMLAVQARVAKGGYALQDWELRRWISAIESLHGPDEPDADRHTRLRHTPITQWTESDIDFMPDPEKTRADLARWKLQHECDHVWKADPVDPERERRGWHPGHCAKCGADMSYDSGD